MDDDLGLDLGPSRHELICARINLIVSNQNTIKRACLEARQELDHFAQEDGLHVTESQESAQESAIPGFTAQEASGSQSEASESRYRATQADQELDSAYENDRSQSRCVARKIFNRIALRTHPDKVKDAKLTRLFLRAKRSNLIELCLILFKVDYSSFLLLTESDLDLITEEIRKQEASNDSIGQSLGHLWSSFSSQQKKDYYTTHIKSKLQKLFTKK
jgi:hypothetical protein